MRLIHTKTLELSEFHGLNIPDYAILSHTWGNGEITFQDWQDLKYCSGKEGWFKIKRACEQAQAHGLDYLWVDTNCIDKTSSAELSEAINSMFAYYRNSRICYAYLGDVDPRPLDSDHMTSKYERHFRRSKWFTRGWTLQELLAPTRLTFFASDWSKIAPRATLASAISTATKISPTYLQGDYRALSQASAAQKMAWVSSRFTTRVEDMAYCLLGIFEINMPLLYGEGSKAFIRLQEEIIRVSNDHTIFCWTWVPSVPKDWVSFLAPDPRAFKYSAGYVRSKSNLTNRKNFMMTNAGLSICLPVVQTFSYYLAILNAQSNEKSNGDPLPTLPYHAIEPPSKSFHVAIPIRGHIETREGHAISGDGDGDDLQPEIMERMSFPADPCFIQPMWSLCQLELFIRSRPGSLGFNAYCARYDELALPFQHGFLLIIDNIRALARSRAEGVFWKGKAIEGFDEPLLRLKPTPTDHIFLTERIDPRRRQNSIDTYPPGLFDISRGLVLLEASSSSSGVLVRLGSVKDGCILFLGLKKSQGSRPPLRFCKFLSAVHWDEGPDHLSTTLQTQVAQIERSEESCSMDNEYKYSVVVNEGGKTRAGRVFLTYIHYG